MPAMFRAHRFPCGFTTGGPFEGTAGQKEWSAILMRSVLPGRPKRISKGSAECSRCVTRKHPLVGCDDLPPAWAVLQGQNRAEMRHSTACSDSPVPFLGNPAEGTATIPWPSGRGMPRPPKNLPPKRVLWPPIPKIVPFVAFHPRLSKNGTGGFAHVLVNAMYTSPFVYDLSVPVSSLFAAPETK